MFFLCLCTSHKDLVTEDSPLTVSPNLKAVVEYLKAQNYQNNDSWYFFPGTDASPESDTLKRLALPVHGRWIRTYVNDIAHEYLKTATDTNLVKAPLEFPPGSFIVKENYRSTFTADKIEKAQSKLAVLTILFKPSKDSTYCATSSLQPYNGEDCYGGDWFYGFYKLDQGEMIDNAVQNHVNSFCVNCHAPSFKTDYVRTLNDIRDPFSQKSTKAYCDRFEAEVMAPQNSVTVSDDEKKKLLDSLDTYATITKLSSTLPSDVPIDPTLVFNILGSEKTKEMFDVYAWKTFIALNWPNKLPNNGVPQRGEADTSLGFTGERSQPTVWETYKPAFEVFQPDSAEWNPKGQAWNQVQPFPKGTGCEATENEFILTMSSKTRDVANETGQAFAGSFGFLVDRNKNKVRYEVLFNRTEFEYLIEDDRAATKNLTPGGPANQINKIRFPDTQTDPSKVGSMEIKSAWKELCLSDNESCSYADAANLEAARKKYYVRKVIIYDEETKTCRSSYAGLIGLHIARKTYYSPQWIWITFEHKDNVPEYGNFAQEANFFNPKPGIPDTCWRFPFLDTVQAVKLCPNVDLNRFHPDFKDQPNQLTRLVPIQKQAATQNTNFINQIKQEGGSSFENYILVDTQWPLFGRNEKGDINPINCADNVKGEDCYITVPRFLRNTVIESYMATYCTQGMDNVQFSNRSCMSCHGAAGTDFSYIWLDGVSQKVKLDLK
jgi:hypothetical protein